MTNVLFPHSYRLVWQDFCQTISSLYCNVTHKKGQKFYRTDICNYFFFMYLSPKQAGHDFCLVMQKDKLVFHAYLCQTRSKSSHKIIHWFVLIVIFCNFVHPNYKLSFSLSCSAVNAKTVFCAHFKSNLPTRKRICWVFSSLSLTFTPPVQLLCAKNCLEQFCPALYVALQEIYF